MAKSKISAGGEFIEAGARQFFPPPYAFSGVDLRYFCVEGTWEKLKQLCARCLGPPLNDRGIFYLPITDRVLILANYVGRAESTDSPSDKLGWFGYVEIAVWILAVRIHRCIPRRVVWFSPYIWVNNPLALEAGREVYGYPKAYADIEPQDPQDPDPITVQTFMPSNSTPRSQWRRQELLRITRVGADGGATPTKFKDFGQSLEHLATRLTDGQEGRIALPGVRSVFKLLRHFQVKGAVLASLKQFRSAPSPRRACFQSVVETPLSVTKFHSGGLLTDKYQIEINPSMNYPLVRDLGLASRTPEVEFGLFVRGDFKLDKGKNISI